MMDGATTRDKLRGWIRGACARAFGGTNGLIKLGLCDVPGSRSTTLIQEFVVPPDQNDDAVEQFVDQIVGEAEMACEGRGGGTATFALTAYRDKQREQCATHLFQVSVEQTDAFVAEETSAKGLLAQTMSQNRELHAANVQMVHACGQAMQKTMMAVANRLDQHEAVLADTLSLLRAGSEQRQLEEANAFAATQSAERWNQIFQMAMPLVQGFAMDYMQKKQAEQIAAQAAAEHMAATQAAAHAAVQAAAAQVAQAQRETITPISIPAKQTVAAPLGKNGISS